jgi:hypothetical protein
MLSKTGQGLPMRSRLSIQQSIRVFAHWNSHDSEGRRTDCLDNGLCYVRLVPKIQLAIQSTK